ncbi:flagellar hook-length control protein FliK [Crenobacter sp. SG2305]|uniref:flagellar hook-length control protein FliK n=1 Tax=Crenobacter oryzisoli TaxID=3056844 RepID=UPI0025AB353F|nr:flagellar hook-length control protein FliK [Crenobacter sp. SG2305]MDN0083445.1 flagellar hook-length control protein FliK [Crenobacter sp. SG2305]
MTIRVQASTTTPVTPGSTTGAGSDSPGDLFAALLGSQLSTAVAGLSGGAQGDKLGAALGDGKGTSHEPSEEDPATTAAVDPGALLAIPVFVPPVVNPTGKAAPAPTTGAAGNAATAANIVDMTASAGSQAELTGVLPNAGQAAAQQNLQPQGLPTVEAGATPLAMSLANATQATPASGEANKAMSSKLETFQNALNDAAASSGAPVNAHALLADAAALARPTGAPPVLVANAAPPLPLSISTHLSDSNWSQALGHQMMTMVNLKSDEAHISLNPPHLGPIEVSLKIDQNQAQVVFNAATPQAREAVENSLPRLASMLAGNGIQLSDAQVSSGQSGNQRQAFGQQQRGRRSDDSVSDEPDTLAAIKTARGILSTFA